jgi:hypothetical protein
MLALKFGGKGSTHLAHGRPSQDEILRMLQEKCLLDESRKEF